MKKVLITGVSGFAGSFLAEFLLTQRKYNIYGTYLIEASLRNISSLQNSIELIKVDLTKTKMVIDIIRSTKPDYIFHLAAMPFTGSSFNNPVETVTNNIVAELNILTGVKDNRLANAKILVVSSAEVYGLVKKENMPIDEQTPFNPTSPYAVSKIAQDFLGLQYFLSHRLKIIRVRPFNHIGPRQSSSFVVGGFARKIAEIEKGKAKAVIQVGNLTAKRDFTDVRDMVRAYVLAIEEGKVGEVYNIGSEKLYKISDILNKLLKLSKVKISVRVDKHKFRPIDIPELLCDAQKFKKLTNWKPQIPLELTLKDTLDYWRWIV